MLEGELVRLRALGPDDLERCHRWMNDPEVTRFIETGRYPPSMAQEREWLDNAMKNGASFSGLILAIETKEGNVHIGNAGLHYASAEHRRANLGIVIGEKEYWSKGYGADTVRTLLRFAFEQMNLNRVELGTFDFNERAQACYRECGFVEEGRRREDRYIDGRYHDLMIMGILRREWEAASGSRKEAD
ncbi:MAG TPA: GNAT family protein [Dehalococcoidia bacterium]|nr:GNAT family protein [Dehalococcoidia bacterium]